MSIRTILELALVAGAGVGGPTSLPKQDVALLHQFAAELRVTGGTGGTLTVLIEDSFDNGVTWNTWLAFTAATGATSEVLGELTSPQIKRPPGGDVRVTYTIATGGTWAFRVRLSANPLR